MSDLKSKAAAQRVAGKISTANSKMPGSTFAADPFSCKVGSKLATVEGSTCSRCYARKLAKIRPCVDKGWKSNQTFMDTAPRHEFVAGMVFQISLAAAKSGETYHRWFDAGDLSSVEALDRIAEIARKTPEIKHWLPTREAKFVKDWRKAGNEFPDNLTVRVSSTMVGDGPREGWVITSTVHRKGETPVGHSCPASTQGGNCGDCRACWSPSTLNVSYPLH